MQHASQTRILTVAVFIAASLASTAPAAAPTIVSTDGNGVKRAIQSHKGRVVVVNLWATWCEPCVEEFPDLVKVYKAHKSQGVTLLSVSMDEPEDRGKVSAFVEKQNSDFTTYIRKSGNVDAFFDPVDRKWSGVVPVTYVYDRTGKLRSKIEGGPQTYAQFEARIKPLLK